MKKILFTLVCGLFFWPLLAQDALQAAHEYSEQKQYEKSSDLLESFIADNPHRKYDIARAWWMQSFNLLHLGNLDMASEANDKSLDMRIALRSGDIAENYLREAQISLRSNNPSAALDAVQRGMQLMIEDPLVYAQLNFYAAQAMKQSGQYDEASAYLNIAREVIVIEVGEKDPFFGEILYAQGELLFQQKDNTGAFQAFSTAFYRLSDPLKRIKSLLRAKQMFELR